MIEPSERLNTWMDGYVDAWTTNDPDSIAALFAEDAVYDPQTAGGEWDGVDEIVTHWTEIDDDPDNFEFQWFAIAENDEMAVVRANTRYHSPPLTYRNLFVIYFNDDGLCRDFTEWYIEEDQG